MAAAVIRALVRKYVRDTIETSEEPSLQLTLDLDA